MTRVNVYLMRVCAALLVIGMTTAAAQATSLSIANPGFDADSLAGNPDGYVLAAPSGWIESSHGTGYQLGTSDSLAARSGANWAFLSPGTTYPDGDALGQVVATGGSAVNVASGGRITVNVYQGHRTDYQASDTQNFQIEIWRDAIGGVGTLVGSSGDFGNVAPGVNSWTLRSYTYTAVTGDIGKNLYFRFFNHGPTQVQLEDASGSYTITPEPSMMVLLVTGLIGLLAYAWRRRR